MKTPAILSTSFVVNLCFLLGAAFGQTQVPQEAPKGASTILAGAPANTTTAATPTPPVRRRFVPVLISVTDGSGNPITGLTKEQLTLTDTNQAVQPLQLYKAPDIPLHLGIVLLCSSASFSQQQAAAIDLVQKSIHPGIDEAFVVAARGKKPWPSERLDWKQDPAELAKTIQALDHDAGLNDAFNFDLKTDETVGDENAGRSTTQYFGGGGPNVFDAIYAMMGSDPRPSRRVVVIFREAWAHSPGFGIRVNGAVEGQLNRVIGVAQEMHIATFVIGLEDPKFNGITDNTIGKTYISLHAGDDGGAGTATRQYDREMESARIRAYNAGKSNVQRIAADTGGATYWSTKKNYPDAVRAIANQLAGQYIVTFTPGDAAGPAHALKVSSSNGARVLAQTVFFLPPAK
jgi:VWFA-related protein